MRRTAASFHFSLALALMLGSLHAAAQTALLFTLSSPAFQDDGLLPLKYAGAQCRSGRPGGNISPPLAWANAPAGSRSFAVLMIDPDGEHGIGSVHWVAYGIPAGTNNLKEGDSTTLSGLVNGKNSRGTIAYSGPCGPPADAPHHYVIDVIALDFAPDALPAGLDRDGLLKAIKGHSLGPASLVVRYRAES